jgi:hypothetical protein
MIRRRPLAGLMPLRLSLELGRMQARHIHPSELHPLKITNEYDVSFFGFRNTPR